MNERATVGQISSEADRIGFFGKLPSHGDFVSTGFGPNLQNVLDGWLQASLQAVQTEFGRDWERRFQAMPAWRFVVERDLWGPATVAGVIVPSLDRVGRSFPLVVATQLHAFAGDPRSLCLDDTWFTASEAMAETSARQDFDIDTFTSRLKRLRALRPGEFDDLPQPPERSSPGAFWWRIDPEDRQMKGFRVSGTPKPADFLRLFANETVAAPSETVPAQQQVEAKHRPATAPRESLKLSHSYASHPGTRLSLNADSVFSSAKPQIFAIADGVGDGSGAVEASRISVGALSETAPQDTIEALVQEIKGKLGRAHGLLQSGQSADRIPSTASIVVLTRLDKNFAVLWAGDARCYLLRDGMMRCLTRDHVDVGLKRSLARGLGLRKQLTPDVFADHLMAGDRFLLCSGPLPRVLTERGIAEILLSSELDDVSAVLAQEALIANCRENFSAMVIDASPGRG